jgi:hypothetical protein
MVGKRVQFDNETWEATEGVVIESLYGLAVVRDTLMSLIVVEQLHYRLNSYRD